MGLAGAVSACTNLQYRARSDAVGAIIVARGAIRVAIYARVSTGEQNPELQLRELRDYAERRGFIVHREYVDQATGDVRRRKRAPEFDAMMADARRGHFDCVLVWKYDRFARCLGALVAAFRSSGILSTSSATPRRLTPPRPWAGCFSMSSAPSPSSSAK